MSGQTVIAHSIATPTHIFWAPERCFFLNAGAHFIAILLLIVWGYGAFLTVTLFSSIGWHLFLVKAYQRDRHCEGVWSARFFMGRRWPWQRTVQVLPFHGNKYYP